MTPEQWKKALEARNKFLAKLGKKSEKVKARYWRFVDSVETRAVPF
jgi:hypothetical protein